MPTPQVIRYPLDPTGVSPDNLVSGEEHTMVQRQTRAIATEYGAFYTQSLKVRDKATNQLLVAGTHYYPAELYELPTARYGKEVCAIIVITDPTVGDIVTLEYQAVGGEFSTSQTAIIQQIEALNLDDRPIEWGSIIDKPDEYTPSHHLHDIGDVYGFEYVVHAIDRVRAAILMGDSASHDEIYAYIDLVIAEVEAAVAQQAADLAAHIARTDNPHQVTLTQLNAYSKPEIDAMFASLGDDTADALAAHIANTNNPHGTTKAQIGLASVLDAPMASTAEALAGAMANRYMAPLTTQQMINQHAASAAHDARYTPANAAGYETSLTSSGGILYAWVAGAWRAVWPPQWQ